MAEIVVVRFFFCWVYNLTDCYQITLIKGCESYGFSIRL